jgi:hypothetical protein
MRCRPALVIAWLVVVVPWLGCVGDDPRRSPDRADGGQDDAARIEDASTAVDAQEASTTCESIPPAPIPANVRCGEKGSQGCQRSQQNVCCNDGRCVTAATCGSSFWECEQPAHCGSTRCCMAALMLDPPGTCPRKATTSPESSCSDSCPSGRFLCTTTADCVGAGTCTAVEVSPVGSSQTYVVGACL